MADIGAISGLCLKGKNMSCYSKQLVEQCYGPEAIHEQIHFIELIHNYENKNLTFYYARTYFLVGSKVTQALHYQGQIGVV